MARTKFVDYPNAATLKENNTPHIVQILFHGGVPKKKRYVIKREIGLK
jgi:hypothetical protein